MTPGPFGALSRRALALRHKTEKKTRRAQGIGNRRAAGPQGIGKIKLAGRLQSDKL